MDKQHAASRLDWSVGVSGGGNYESCMGVMILIMRFDHCWKSKATIFKLKKPCEVVWKNRPPSVPNARFDGLCMIMRRD